MRLLRLLPLMFAVPLFAVASVRGTLLIHVNYQVVPEVSFDIRLTNDGTSPATRTTISVPIPFPSHVHLGNFGESQRSCVNSRCTWVVSLAPGETRYLYVDTISVGPPGDVITAQGDISFDSDGNGSLDSSAVTDNPLTPEPSDASTVTIHRPLVTATMATPQDIYVVGDTVTYTVTLMNSGDMDTKDVLSHGAPTFIDLLPPELEVQSATASTGWTPDLNGNYVWWRGTIPAGGTVILTMTARAKTAAKKVVNQGWVFDEAAQNSTHVYTNAALISVGDPAVPALSPISLALLAGALALIASKLLTPQS